MYENVTILTLHTVKDWKQLDSLTGAKSQSILPASNLSNLSVCGHDTEIWTLSGWKPQRPDAWNPFTLSEAPQLLEVGWRLFCCIWSKTFDPCHNALILWVQTCLITEVVCSWQQSERDLFSAQRVFNGEQGLLCIWWNEFCTILFNGQVLCGYD